MALNVPDVGENKMLEHIVNKTAPENLVLRLFTNNITPADSDVAGTYTEANTSNFPGYSAITLIGASWGAASGGTIAYAQQSFVCTGVATADIYGYYLTQATSGVLMWSEKDGAAPFAVRNSGDTVRVTPTLSAN